MSPRARFAVFAGALIVAASPLLMAVSGGGIPSFLKVTYLGVNTAPATSGATRVAADNGGVSGDTEVLSQTTNVGDPYFRTFPTGRLSWSFGAQRASTKFQLCQGTGLSTNCVFLSSASIMTLQPTATIALNAPTVSTTATTVPWCNSNGGLNCPWVLSFSLSHTGGTATPTVTSCNHCSSPTVSRTGTGSWQLQPGVSLNGNSVVLCTIHGSLAPTNYGTIFFGGDAAVGGNSVLIRWFAAAGGALTDPTGSSQLDCAVGT